MIRRQKVSLLIATVIIVIIPSLTIATGGDGLVAHYPFDGDTLDVSGNENHATGHGGVSFVLGVHGGAVSFDGSSGYLEADGDGPLALSQWTISVWVNPRANTDTQAMLVGKPNQSSRFNYNLSFASPSQVRSRYESNQTSDDRDFIVEGPQLVLNTWTHVVSTRDGSGNHCLYIDGAQYDCELHTAAPAANTAPLWMGKWYSPPLNLFYSGDLDDVRIYNRALSEPEIADIFSGSATERITFVALGDSYSSGEGAGDYKIDLNGDDDTSDSVNGLAENTDRKDIDECHRSKWAWSTASPGKDPSMSIDIAFGELDLRPNTFAACSGAVISDLFNARFRSDESPGKAWQVPPQVEVLSNSTDLISLTIGGNDVEFAKIIEACLIMDSCASRIPLGWDNQLEDEANRLIDVLGAERLQLAYENLKAAAPNASIFVLGYPHLTGSTLWDPCGIPDPLFWGEIIHPFDSSELEFFGRLATRLNRAILCSAQRAGVHFVPVEKYFRNHEYCGLRTDYIHGLDRLAPLNFLSLRWKEAFHPNKAGQKAYARAFRDELQALGAAALSNPDPKPLSELPSYCSIFSKASKIEAYGLPSMGALTIEHPTSPICNVGNSYVPGQQVRLVGGGFATSASLQTRFTAVSGGFQRDMANISADADGEFDALLTLPGDAPNQGMALIEVGGTGASDEGRVLLGQIVLVQSLTDDGDYDGVPDACDNCPDDINTGQDDSDGDGIGNVCDSCPLDSENDLDQDGLCADLDPCPFDPYNDVNGDGICGEVDGGFFADNFENGNLLKWSISVGLP